MNIELECPPSLRWIGFDAMTDTAIVLIARDPETPIIWYNPRHVRCLPVGLIELWANHQLASGRRFAVADALDVAAMHV